MSKDIRQARQESTGVDLFDEDIENNLVGSIIFHRTTDMVHMLDIMKYEYFYGEKTKELYGILQDRFLQDKPLFDLDMIANQMVEKGFKDFTSMDLFKLGNDLPVYIDIDEYAGVIKELYYRRLLRENLINLRLLIEDRTEDYTKTMSSAFKMLTSDDKILEDESETLTQTCMELEERIVKNYNGITEEGLKTGFSRLDQFGGMHRKDLIIIGADSSQGKTALGVNILMNAVFESGAKVLIFSMELTGLQLTARILAPETGYQSSALMYKKPDETGLAVARQGLEKLRTVGENVIFGDASKQTADQIIQSIRLNYMRHGVNLVMIDFLQIISYPYEKGVSKAEKIAEATRAFKNLAKELGITILLISQINREFLKMANPEPTAGGLRGSGEINEASDLTILIYRPEAYNRQYTGDESNIDPKGTALIKVVKDRNGGYGGVGRFIVNFDGETTRFFE